MSDFTDFDELSAQQRAEVESLCVEFEAIVKQTHSKVNSEEMGQCLQDIPAELQQHAFRSLLRIELKWLRNKSIVPDRANYLERFPEREEEIQRQFTSHGGSVDGFSTTAVFDSAPVEKSRVTGVAPGAVIDGRYTIISSIGEGGMGAVFLAQQNAPVSRKVAIKFIKGGLDSEAVVARFDMERSVLALMEHPGIAQVFDGGQTGDGVPYFVMEFVDGHGLNTYCDRNRLSIHDRLALFVSVCKAVQHAHLKGIIHRDLKPGNILVNEVDGVPSVKVIDFGVAKAVDGNVVKSNVSTTALVIGTPVYMSPEQAVPGNSDIDVRSDVYSLGVILYELLIGVTPHEFAGASGDILELLSEIRDSEAPKPSTKFGSAKTGTEIASLRRTNAEKLAKLLQGDLDWIVLRALEKDRDRRYLTVSAFAQDVNRYLANEMVHARPPSRRYRLRKFVVRNRGAVLAGCVLLLTLTVGIIGTSWGMFEARYQAEVAEGESRKKNVALLEKQSALEEETRQRQFAEAISDFLEQDFLDLTSDGGRLAWGIQAINEFSNLEDMLDRAVRKLEARSDLAPEIEARLRLAIARSYAFRASANKAVPQYEKCIKLLSQLEEESSESMIECLVGLGSCLTGTKREKDALSLFKRSSETSKAVLGKAHPLTLHCRGMLGNAYRFAGDSATAIDIHEQCLEIARTELEPTNLVQASCVKNLSQSYLVVRRWEEAGMILEDVLEAFKDEELVVRQLNDSLANVYINQGRFSEALPLVQDAVNFSIEAYGEESRKTMDVMQGLILCLNKLGRTEESILLGERVVEIGKTKFGENDPRYMNTALSLAMAYRAAGLHEKSLQMFQQQLDWSRATYGDRHLSTLWAMSSIQSAAFTLGNHELANEMGEKLLENAQGVVSDDHEVSIRTRQLLGLVAYREGNYETSVAVYEELLAVRRRTIGEDHPLAVLVMSDLAVNYRDAGRLKDSIETLESMRAKLGVVPDLASETLQRLFACYLLDDQHDAARELLPTMLKARKEAVLNDRVSTLGAWDEYASTLMQADQWKLSLTLIRQWLNLQQESVPEFNGTYVSHRILGDTLIELERFDEAKFDLTAAYEGTKVLGPLGVDVSETLRLTVNSLIRLNQKTNNDEGVQKWERELATLKQEL